MALPSEVDPCTHVPVGPSLNRDLLMNKPGGFSRCMREGSLRCYEIRMLCVQAAGLDLMA